MFDPSAHDFYDPPAVEKEMRRVADICHTCRRCYDLCPSFDVLFRALDRPEVDGEAERLTPADLDSFSDLCYECKLCIPHCPYYPPHRWEVDVPRIVLRDRASRVKQAGRPALRERILSSTDAVGKVASAAAPLVNAVNNTRAARVLLEKTIGVHRDRLLPSYSSETFLAWWRRRSEELEASQRASAGGDRVALFATCFANYNAPEVARAAVAVLEKNGCVVEVPPQRCCGMPFLESGDIDSAQECRSDNVRSFSSLAREGVPIVVPGPTCSLAIRKEYPLLSGDPETRAVSSAVLDLSEYLMRRHAEKKLAVDFRRSPGRILYHVPCHLKVQDIGFKSRDLLSLIPGAEVVTVERCTGHDGTWSMKTEYFPLSLNVGEPLFEQVRRERPDTVASDCPLAGVQIRQGTGRAVKHPIQIVAEAYGLTADS